MDIKSIVTTMVIVVATIFLLKQLPAKDGKKFIS